MTSNTRLALTVGGGAVAAALVGFALVEATKKPKSALTSSNGSSSSSSTSTTGSLPTSGTTYTGILTSDVKTQFSGSAVVTTSTSTPQSMQVGQKVVFDLALPASSGYVWVITPGSTSGATAATWGSASTMYAPMVNSSGALTATYSQTTVATALSAGATSFTAALYTADANRNPIAASTGSVQFTILVNAAS